MSRKSVFQMSDGGFFSIVIGFVSYLVWELSTDPDNIIMPDWRVAKLKERLGNKFTSFCYGREEDGNLWLKLFEPLPYKNVSIENYNSEAALYNNATIFNTWNEEREPLLTADFGYQLYKRKDFQPWRYWYHLYFHRYCKVRPHIQKRVDNFANQYFKDKIVIAAHVRHPSHAIEQQSRRMPTLNDYLHKINETIAQFNLPPEQLVLFIATDQQSVITFFKTKFTGKMVYIEDVKRLTEQDDIKFAQLSDEEKCKEGHQIQHITAANDANWNIVMAEEVLIDALLLARSDYFIHISSNVAKAVAFINPVTKMIYCEDIVLA